MSETTSVDRGWAAATTLGLTALVYALLVGVAGVAFYVTPLTIGIGGTLAGVLARRPRLLAIGVAVGIWGIAVVLVREGVVPHAREGAAFMTGVAAGLLVAAVIARRHHFSMVGPAIALIASGVAYYLAFDVEFVDDWPFWTGVLVLWAVVEGLRRPEA